ncbi:MAG: nucleoside hydrolase [Anaerolineaceae bacterium]|nr:nucleoside hydrolase [Anaerolineaceae bacterium]
MRQPVFVDTDISLGTSAAEIDDGAAIIVLCNSPEVELRGISLVYGNVRVGMAHKNISRLLSYLGREDIPVAPGAASPLVADAAWSEEMARSHAEAHFFTPDFPVRKSELQGPDLLINAIRSAPGEITVLAIGPLTNLAIALERAPDIEKSVRQVIAMGGAFGKSPSSTEFNIRNDPEAAGRVLRAGWPVRLIGLEITHQVLFTRADFNGLDGSRPDLALLKNQAADWIPFVEMKGWESGGCCLHDAIAAATLLDEGIADYIEARLDVDTEQGPRRGVTVFSENGLNRANGRKTIAVSLDVKRCHKMIMDRLASKNY